MHRRWLFFTAVGPLLGFLIAFAGLVAFSAVGGHTREAFSWLSWWQGLVLFAYLFGGPPALVAGVVAGVVRRETRLRQAASCAIVGGLATLLWTLVIAYQHVKHLSAPLIGLSILGAATAAACAVLAPPQRPRADLADSRRPPGSPDAL